MSLSNGIYRTGAGSRLEVSGKHCGSFRLTFEYFDEAGACFECEPNPVPEEWAPGEWRVTWTCRCHQPGSARLYSDDAPPSIRSTGEDV